MLWKKIKFYENSLTFTFILINILKYQQNFQIIHFKRFVYMESSKTWIKSSKVVDFPIQHLDLKEWSSNIESSRSTVYNCFAIAVGFLYFFISWNVNSFWLFLVIFLNFMKPFYYRFRIIMALWLLAITLLMLKIRSNGSVLMIVHVR